MENNNKPAKFFTWNELSISSYVSTTEVDGFRIQDHICMESLERLDYARSMSKVPFILNCSYRSPLYESLHGRTGTSAHTYGRAFDIRALDSRTRYEIISNCIAAGFTRIGIAKSYVHVDDSPKHASEVIWLY